MSIADRPAPAQEAMFAPGLRVEIRDAEWVIKRADLTSSGTYSLLVTGISELVRGKEARFLTEIDRDIKPLHPEDTELVPDTSPRFAKARLYLESLLRQAPPTDSNLWIGHRAAIDVLPYQLDPALQALGQIRHRILLADSVGLGKTIEVGVLLAELIRRGKGKRNVAVRGTRSARAKLAELLGDRSDTMILASATPHDGRPESFASLMNMLNPTAIANPKVYGPEDIEGLFLRRFKKDVQEQTRQVVPGAQDQSLAHSCLGRRGARLRAGFPRHFRLLR